MLGQMEMINKTAGLGRIERINNTKFGRIDKTRLGWKNRLDKTRVGAAWRG